MCLHMLAFRGQDGKHKINGMNIKVYQKYECTVLAEWRNIAHPAIRGLLK